jgi:RimJ/RimL family protein N-acetyltransferase
MSEFRIHVRDNFYLSSVTPEDKPALLEHLKAKEIHDNTLSIPYPYLESHADFWINKQIERLRAQQIETVFALRDAGKMIGVVGADGFELGSSHRAEMGYWLAKPYWGTGIMTDAVRAFIKYAFSELGLLRLTGHVFNGNQASARVLEKNGFSLEGRLRKHYLKNGELLDGRVYGLLKEEIENFR